MDIYTFSLALGGAGLAVMALGSIGHHGHGQSHGHGGHGHGGHGHGGHGHAGHGHAGHAAHGHDAGHAHGVGHGLAGGAQSALLWTLATPRLVFATLLGFGAAGLLLRTVLGGMVLLVVALLAGLAFERFAIRPLMNLLFGFASSPALTLESTLFDEARAASGFDANGEGLIAVDVDGQVVQVLGTLRPEDRALGVRVRAGDRLRIEDVDGERHRCTVSYLGPRALFPQQPNG
ncbi:hypothetical protein [Gemmatirosa kalamazoonensis]|nr:hypothetical protein [Gemmatirosa kalamazoonensis]